MYGQLGSSDVGLTQCLQEELKYGSGCVSHLHDVFSSKINRLNQKWLCETFYRLSSALEGPGRVLGGHGRLLGSSWQGLSRIPRG